MTVIYWGIDKTHICLVLWWRGWVKTVLVQKRLFLGAAVISPGRPAISTHGIHGTGISTHIWRLNFMIGKSSPEPWGRGDYSKLSRHQVLLPMGCETNPEGKHASLVWFRDSLLKIYIETERDKSCWWLESWVVGRPKVWWTQNAHPKRKTHISWTEGWVGNVSHLLCAQHQIAAFPQKKTRQLEEFIWVSKLQLLKFWT